MNKRRVVVRLLVRLDVRLEMDLREPLHRIARDACDLGQKGDRLFVGEDSFWHARRIINAVLCETTTLC